VVRVITRQSLQGETYLEVFFADFTETLLLLRGIFFGVLVTTNSPNFKPMWSSFTNISFLSLRPVSIRYFFPIYSGNIVLFLILFLSWPRAALVTGGQTLLLLRAA
jgi:hypothetical protein